MVDTSDLQFPNGESVLDVIAAMRRPSAPIGTKDNPWVLVVPQWFVDRCTAEGTTPQEVGEQIGLPTHTRIDVMKDYE